MGREIAAGKRILRDELRQANAKRQALACRIRGAESLRALPKLIGLTIADLAAPQGKSPALSVSSIERWLSGLVWCHTQRGAKLDRKDRHFATVLAGTRHKLGRPPAQKKAILHEDLRDMRATLTRDPWACVTESSC